ncbi:SusD/RagB family nutrient-binding outer membrane lipoprotein [Phocaeicola sartorii]|uniref:SusD/RagB family nutrient-binding outer membrane lipoprotein n=1 Tax=Phocaeicola sartorii TaxID=671267 RepID=UPI002431616D|nr:SusD/RagB family nutrient-binding outer membrane lipoprotein [Phocaeicola sartorii]
MKNKILALLLISSALTACTDHFEKFNTEDGAYTEDKQGMDFAGNTMYFQAIEQGIYFNDPAPGGTDWTFQIIQNLNVDMFAGYFHDMASKFFPNNSCYNLNDGWNSAAWSYTYQYTVSAINKCEAANTDRKQFLGINKILKVATLHRLTDIYGAILYSDFMDFVPDSQEATYKAMFADLDKGIELLDEALAEGIPENAFAEHDILMQSGNRTLSAWSRWANSLRLRLAMRVSNVDKNLAQTEAQKALNDKHGLIETNAQGVFVSTEKGYKNPLGTIGLSWWEVYASANMESLLTGYGDPRASKYFTPAVGGNEGVPGNYKPLFDYSGTFKGIPMGLGGEKNIPAENNAYKYHARSTIQVETPAPLMTAAEVWFLRAEAALRGFSSENVKNCYETGVRLSFEQWKATGVEEYLDSESKPIDYKDVFDATCNMKAASSITPKWNDTVGNEENLERIITQKWLAMYPEGGEAWAEQRRTGYPKLFKVLHNESQGTIDTDIMIRRLPYPSNLATDQPQLYQQLTSALGGADNGGTRLWWDTGKNNF